MCGRYTLGATPESLIEHFQLFGDMPAFQASYNIAPSESVPIVYQHEGQRVAGLMRWGMIPSWSKEPKTKYSTINAKAETLTESKLYAGPFKRSRCLVPADGFYEWQQANGKQPYHICMENHQLFAFAGLWETWHAGQDDELHTFTIITTDANPAMSAIHKRMPVILDSSDWSSWLLTNWSNPDADETKLLNLLKPYDGRLVLYPVSKAVNSPKSKSIELIQAINNSTSQN